jgi:hypothetical protein
MTLLQPQQQTLRKTTIVWTATMHQQHQQPVVYTGSRLSMAMPRLRYQAVVSNWFALAVFMLTILMGFGACGAAAQSCNLLPQPVAVVTPPDVINGIFFFFFFFEC